MENDILWKRQVEELRGELHRIVDEKCDRILAGGFVPDCTVSLNMNAGFFKGKKPEGVLIGEEEIPCLTWKQAAVAVMKDCDFTCHDRLMALRNRAFGQKRTILSDSADGMDAPVRISEGLYLETKYDTETLINVMKKRVLDVVGYDYGRIRIRLKKQP